MDIGTLLKLGPYEYRIIDRRESRVLVSWTEKSGEVKEIWLILPVSMRNLEPNIKQIFKIDSK